MSSDVAGPSVPTTKAPAVEDSNVDRMTSFRDNQGLAILCGLFAFIVFMLTLYPDLSGGDSGELTAAAYAWGTGHPPGYPLYSITSKLFTFLIPYGNVAYRVNVGTAAIGAAAAYFLFLATARFCRQDACGVLAAALYSFCPLVWSFHIQGEVFALNNMFSAMLVYVTLLFFDTLSIRHARWGAFIMGLGLTNQHTLIVFEGPLMVSVVAVGWRKLLGFELLKLAFLFFLGFSIYAFMPISTSNSPYVCWGDCHHWEGFARHLFRVEYGSFRLYADEKEQGRLSENLKFWSIDVVNREVPMFEWLFAPVGLIYPILQAAKGNTRGRGMEYALAFAWCFYMIGFHSLANFPLGMFNPNTDTNKKLPNTLRSLNNQMLTLAAEGHPENVEIIMRFWMQPNTVFMLYIAEGLRIAVTACWHKFGSSSDSSAKETTTAPKQTTKSAAASLQLPALVGIGLKALWTIVLLSVAVQIARWYDWIDQSDNYCVPAFGREMLDALPPNALFLTMGDITTNSVRYVQTAENYRTDVYMIDQNILSSEWFTELHSQNFPGVVFPDKKFWPGSLDGFDSREFFNANLGKYRIFVFPGIKDESWKEEYVLVPWGYAEEVMRPKRPVVTPWDFDEYEWLRLAHTHLPPVPKVMEMPESKYPTGSWEYKPKDYFWNCMERYGSFTMKLLDVDRELAVDVALKIFKQGSSVAPHEGAYIGFHKSLGVACYHGLSFLPPEQALLCMHQAWTKWITMVRAGAMAVHGPATHEHSMNEADHLERILAQHALPEGLSVDSDLDSVGSPKPVSVDLEPEDEWGRLDDGSMAPEVYDGGELNDEWQT